MEKFIEIYDNFLPQKLENLIENNILYNTDYRFTSNTVSSQDKTYIPSLSKNFMVELTTLNTNYLIYFNILFNFLNSQNLYLTQLFLARAFLQFPTISPKIHPPHTDLSLPHWVCLYYANDSDGDTIFYDDKNNEIKRISPKKGRMAFFDGSILHSGSTPQNTHRAVINFDFKGEQI
tara:strand:- start:87 stop:617 length:531 start_codon:yes stop_codon:yes gene_type:complete